MMWFRKRPNKTDTHLESEVRRLEKKQQALNAMRERREAASCALEETIRSLLTVKGAENGDS